MCYSTLKENVVCICGLKNSGKTTFIERLVIKLMCMGFKVAVIKHDGHDFKSDVAGTDSDRFRAAGAYGTAIYSKNRMMFVKETDQPQLEDILPFYQDADIVLVEGLKFSTYPKIELVRKEISILPVSKQEGRFLIVTDTKIPKQYGVSKSFEQIDQIVKLILNQLGLAEEINENDKNKRCAGAGTMS